MPEERVMAAKGPKTNEEWVVRTINYSRFGALSQMFVMQAIEKYAEACAKEPAATFDSPMLNGAAWVGVATEIRDSLKAFYERPAR
jgi:hypothetical protein